MVLPVAVTPYRKTSPARANARPIRTWLAPPISGTSTTAGIGAGDGAGSHFGAAPAFSDRDVGARRARRGTGSAVGAAVVLGPSVAAGVAAGDGAGSAPGRSSPAT